MYEIWLVLNILWELALDALPVIIGLALLWAALAWAASRRPFGTWRRALPPALAAAVLAGVMAFALVPTATRSSLSELRYWVDWANLVGIAAAAAALTLAFAWPALALLLDKRAAAATRLGATATR
jgi:Co/Zn/Cd efflux system component